ncbi:MAG: aminotransferase class I/II-fold pyridoxal phosphate-dependent enzyme [Candidatus Krumholzibacteria bacterium]|nr:aminotransferase class I/II-fold pyridoxal phosphate-dependent enzyme [Candidatus Krumholzibacteria bacterium]
MNTPFPSNSLVDMRSDTVTRPTPEMLEAMMIADVGDDVFGDDPTVNRLQSTVADLLGKEAALYVPSGTMGNQLALRAQTRPGDQIVLEDGAHIYRYEAGAPAALCGLLVTCVETPDGLLDWTRVEAALNPDNVHCAPPGMVSLENTHNRAGGRILPQKDVQEISDQVHARGVRVHLDGARLWHAHVATGLTLAELAAPVDSVSVCFSKALGAPVGSMLAADRATIAQAHRFRKMWGGGMRQAGILAAACLYALDHNLARLAEDHEHARVLAAGLDHPALKVNHPVDTNIVIIDVEGPGQDEALLGHLENSGVLGVGFGPGRVRLVPHLEHSDADIGHAVEALNSFAGDRS